LRKKNINNDPYYSVHESDAKTNSTFFLNGLCVEWVIWVKELCVWQKYNDFQFIKVLKLCLKYTIAQSPSLQEKKCSLKNVMVSWKQNNFCNYYYESL